MENQGTFITVIITSYNRKKYLIDAVKSVLSTTLERDHFEIILVKNYSDNEIDSFCSLNNIKNLNIEGSIGHFYSKAMDCSKGDIISFLDDDDMWVDDKLRKVYEAFKKNNNLGYYHNEYVYINEMGKRINYRRVVERKRHLLRHSPSLYIDNKKKKNSLLTLFGINADFNMSSISIRKAILGDKGYGLLDYVLSFQDGAFFFMSMASDCDMLIDSRALTLYRINNGSVTHFDDGAKRIRELKKMVNSMIAVKYYIEELGNYEYFFLEDAINCFIYENLIMIEIFSLANRRKKIIEYLIRLITIRKKYTNNLRNKVVLMAIVSIFSQKVSINLYDKLKNIIISENR